MSPALQRRFGALLLGLVALVAPLEAESQSGTVVATLDVLLPPIAGSGLRGLSFGEVAPGATAEVLPGSPVSGWFRIDNVGRNRDAQLTLLLPKNLARSGGGDVMPIHFDGAYLQSCGNGCQTHTLSPASVSATHNSATVVHVRPGPPYGANPTTLDVYLGGRLEPTADQASGVYEASVELNMALL